MPTSFSNRRVGHHGGMSDQDDFPLSVSESLDSDEVRNADGDEVADPPERWIEAKDDETLDERLAEEEPDVSAGREDSGEAHDSGQGGGLRLESDADLDRIDPEQHGRTKGQIDGTPEDGDSFFSVQE